MLVKFEMKEMQLFLQILILSKVHLLRLKRSQPKVQPFFRGEKKLFFQWFEVSTQTFKFEWPQSPKSNTHSRTHSHSHTHTHTFTHTRVVEEKEKRKSLSFFTSTSLRHKIVLLHIHTQNAEAVVMTVTFQTIQLSLFVSPLQFPIRINFVNCLYSLTRL